jgi:hypothetical protein
MRVIRTETEIDAPPAEVWAVLTDFPSYPAWNPFIQEASGTLAVGEILTMRMHLGERPPQTFTPEVLAVRENAELRWRGTLRWQWLFSAEHLFELSRSGERTRLVHSEQFRGVLVPLLRKMIDETEREYLLLNAALKDRVEAG